MVGQSGARELHERLLAALSELRRAEKSAVLIFAEIRERKLYRELGYSDVVAYAMAELGFSRTKAYEFLRLADSIKELPALRDAVESGELPWTKARAVAGVATKRSDRKWVELAKRSSVRELDREVRARRKEPDGQGELLGARPLMPDRRVSRSFSLTPEQEVKYTAATERLRKSGDSRSREELLVAALTVLADGESTRWDSGSPHQIVIYRCEECGRAKLPSGDPLPTAATEQAACDCREHREGEPNRASIPRSKRRAVLARDGHRCAMPGCGRTRFLEVHHRVPRARGGTNEPANLVTLCSACHRLVHETGFSPPHAGAGSRASPRGPGRR